MNKKPTRAALMVQQLDQRMKDLADKGLVKMKDAGRHVTIQDKAPLGALAKRRAALEKLRTFLD